MEDQKIIDLYFARDEWALEMTKEKYGAYCHGLAYGILDNDADAEETVNDTWLRAWNAIPPQRPKVLKLFLAKITRNLALNTYRNRTAQKRGSGEVALALEELGECIPAQGDVQDALNARELSRVIQKFLQMQPRRERSMFLCRYFGIESLPAIAVRHGVTEGNARKILTRTRHKLKEYLIKEGYTV